MSKDFDDHSKALIKVVTMNVLAPCYNKVNGLCYESELQVEYMNRHRFICTKLLETGADIICLQEFWSSSPSLRNLYITELCKPESGGEIFLPECNFFMSYFY